jgi:hypothetical protein
MPYHYSVARAASQGTGLDSGTFAAWMARGGSSTGVQKSGLDGCGTGAWLETSSLDAGDRPAIRFLGENDGHANTARIRLFELNSCFPGKTEHDGLASHELNVFDVSLGVGPTGQRENAFCGVADARWTNPQIALGIHELAIGGKHRCKLKSLAICPGEHERMHGSNSFCCSSHRRVRGTRDSVTRLLEFQAAIMQEPSS